MKSLRDTLSAYVELSRLSNAPTVISNVFVGVAIGSISAGIAVDWRTIIGLSIAMLLLYIGGMALNDAVDATIDSRERPRRPIPSGRISQRAACGFAFACMLIGVAIAATFGYIAWLLAMALTAGIVLYDVWHKRFAASVILMGACRGLVYLTAAAAVAEHAAVAGAPFPLDLRIVLPLVIAITLYITLLTLIARGEARDGVSHMAVRMSVLMIAIALAPALFIAPGDWMIVVIAASAMIGWLVYAQGRLISGNVKAAVIAGLAGICLLDAYYLALLEQPLLALIAAACFVLTVASHRAVAGT